MTVDDVPASCDVDSRTVVVDPVVNGPTVQTPKTKLQYMLSQLFTAFYNSQKRIYNNNQRRCIFKILADGLEHVPSHGRSQDVRDTVP